MPNPSVGDVLGKLGELEATLSRFYAACAEQWPADAAFWNRVRDEEALHARYVARMRTLIEHQPTHFSLNEHFRTPVLHAFIERVKKLMAEIETGKLSQKQAVALAMDIEESLVEKKFAEAILSDREDFYVIRDKLTEESGEHRHYFQTRLAQLREEKP